MGKYTEALFSKRPPKEEVPQATPVDTSDTGVECSSFDIWGPKVCAHFGSEMDELESALLNFQGTRFRSTERIDDLTPRETFLGSLGWGIVRVNKTGEVELVSSQGHRVQVKNEPYRQQDPASGEMVEKRHLVVRRNEAVGFTGGTQPDREERDHVIRAGKGRGFKM